MCSSDLEERRKGELGAQERVIRDVFITDDDRNEGIGSHQLLRMNDRSGDAVERQLGEIWHGCRHRDDETFAPADKRACQDLTGYDESLGK